MKLSVRKDSVSALGDDFVDVYKSVFGKWTLDGNCPYHVYLVYDDDRVVGFASGFAIGLQTWYLQRAGFIKSEQKRISNYYRATFGVNEILKEWPAIMTFVHNEDQDALRMVMALGFKIIGTRIDTVKRLWVEFLKEKPNG